MIKAKLPPMHLTTLAIALLGAVAFSAHTQAAEPGLERYKTLAEMPFSNDYPTDETLQALEDELYFQRAVQVYHWALPAMNMYAMKEGAASSYGEGYNVVSIWKDRLDAKTLITTPNSDVIYGVGFLDLAKDGPMVIEAPPKLQALIDDFWHRPIEGPTIDGRTYYADIGLPGPDKGAGGKYLVVPADYKGEAPEGYYLYRSQTNGVFVFLRGFFDDPNNLGPTVANMEKIKIYPFSNKASAPAMQFPNASGKPADLLAPDDGAYFDMLDRFVQSDIENYPDTAFARGLMAEIGIAKGEQFKPDARQKELLDYAAKTAWKMAKAVAFDQFEALPKAKWYADRQWLAHVRNGGDDLTAFVDDFNYQVKDTHRIDVDSQLHMFINAYSMSPGMMTSTPDVGAKYLEAAKDADGEFLTGDHTYQLTLPPNVPAKLFWSVTAYDATTAAGLENGKPFPSIGSKDDVQANADGSTTLYFGPKAPAGNESNWVATVPGKGWFSLLRLYGPGQTFFDKQWIPGDFEKVQ